MLGVRARLCVWEGGRVVYGICYFVCNHTL